MTILRSDNKVVLYGKEFELDKMYEYVVSTDLSTSGINGIFSYIRTLIPNLRDVDGLYTISIAYLCEQWENFVYKNPYSQSVMIMRNNKPTELRFVRAIETFLREKYAFKLDTAQKTALGNYMNQTKTAPYLFKLTNKFNWKDGEFADRGSCYWADRKHAKFVIKDQEGLAIQIFDKHTLEGVGRAWMFPQHPQHPEIISLFNGYGVKNGLREIAQIFCDFLNVHIHDKKFTYTTISLRVNGDYNGLVYINGASGICIHPEPMEKPYNFSSAINYKLKYGWTQCEACHKEIEYGAVRVTSDNHNFCHSCIVSNPNYIFVHNEGTYVPVENVLKVFVRGINFTNFFEEGGSSLDIYQTSTSIKEGDLPDEVFHCDWSDGYWRKRMALIVNGRFTSPEAVCCTRICRACFQRYFIEESFANSELVCDNCYGYRAMPPQMSIESVLKAFTEGKPARTRHGSLFTDGITLWSSSDGIDISIGKRVEKGRRTEHGVIPVITTYTNSSIQSNSYFRDWSVPALTRNHNNRAASYYAANCGYHYHYQSIDSTDFFIADVEEQLFYPAHEQLMKSERDSFRNSRKLPAVNSVHEFNFSAEFKD